MNAIDSGARASPGELSEAFKRAANQYNLCPNRLWSVAKENLPKLLPDDKSIISHEKRELHELCTFDFCEYSQRDFTAVEQRHECGGTKECVRLQGLFSRDTLNTAAKSGKSTVWSLDGKSIIAPPLPFMAISHVWSDGTGTGGQDGEVNDCLYSFFQRVANNFNATESGGTLSVFPETRPRVPRLSGRSTAITKTPESLWSMTASFETGNGSTPELHALPFLCHPGSVEAGPRWS
jgi:hypothetical protein